MIKGRAETERIEEAQLFEGRSPSQLYFWASNDYKTAIDYYLKLDPSQVSNVRIDKAHRYNIDPVYRTNEDRLQEKYGFGPVQMDRRYPQFTASSETLELLKPEIYSRHIVDVNPAEFVRGKKGLEFDKLQEERVKILLHNNHAGMIIAERGMGKTFFARKLATEVPTKFYELNKETLDYEILSESPDPTLVIADDVHYLLQAMRLGILKGNPKKQEEDVIHTLTNVVEESKELGVKTVFIADEYPQTLSSNFESETNAQKFIDIFKDQNIDEHRLYERPHIYAMRNKLDASTALRIRQQFGMKDVPLRVQPRLFEQAYYETLRVPREDEDSRTFCRDFVVYQDKEFADDIKKSVPIQPIRMLKVLADELGEISRMSLGLDHYHRTRAKHKKFGERVEDVASTRQWAGPDGKTLENDGKGLKRISVYDRYGDNKLAIEPGGWAYALHELSIIQDLIQAAYEDVTGKETLSLAQRLLMSEDEKQWRINLVQHELDKE